jgi:hypothetical protein
MSTKPKRTRRESDEAARIDGELMGYLYALQPSVEGFASTVRKAITEAKELSIEARKASSEWPITRRVASRR